MDIFDKIEEQKGQWSPEDTLTLKAILDSQSGKRILAQVLQQADAMARNLSNLNLVSEEGRLEAIKLQGQRRGLIQAVELILELTESQTEENENG